MITYRTLGMLAASLLALASKTHAEDISIDLGSLYGNNRINNPTTVVSESDLIPEGTELFWFCLDYSLNSPANRVLNYSISDDMLSLEGGVWRSFADSTTIDILTATTYMYYNNQDAILADLTGRGAAYDFQNAVWYLSSSRANNVWTGELDSSAMDQILHWNWGRYNNQTPDGIEQMLLSGLTPADGPEIFWGSSSSSSFQPLGLVCITPIPEPSGGLLLAVSGALMILRRRSHRC